MGNVIDLRAYFELLQQINAEIRGMEEELGYEEEKQPERLRVTGDDYAG